MEDLLVPSEILVKLVDIFVLSRTCIYFNDILSEKLREYKVSATNPITEEEFSEAIRLFKGKIFTTADRHTDSIISSTIVLYDIDPEGDRVIDILYSNFRIDNKQDCKFDVIEFMSKF